MMSGILSAQGGFLDNATMSGSLGSVIINGKIYNQLSLRPEIPIGRLGIGLDIYLYIDSDGNVYKNSWDFSDGASIAQTILDKIYYIRWAQPGDPFYARLGALPEATLGHGILVNHYSNMIEYPSVRRIGLDLEARYDNFKLEYIQSDFKHKPGMAGMRLAYPFLPKVSVGVSFVTDMDQYAGLIDSDGDDVPDAFDDLPDDDNFYDQVEADHDLWFDVYSELNAGDSTGFGAWFENSETLPRNEYSKDDFKGDSVSGVGLDLTYQFSDRITLYSQFAQLIGETKAVNGESDALGFGLVPLGMYTYWGPVSFRAEYRYAKRNFLFNYWDQAYDVNRVTIHYDAVNDSNYVITKESQLYRFGDTKGFYAHMSLNLLNFVTLGTGYQHMSGDIWDDSIDDYTDNTNKTFMGSASLNTSFIPKVRKAMAFYQQSNVPNPFDFEVSPTTIFGYDIGVEVSSGVMIVYKSRTTYVTAPDGELDPVHSMQFETQIIF